MHYVVNETNLHISFSFIDQGTSNYQIQGCPLTWTAPHYVLMCAQHKKTVLTFLRDQVPFSLLVKQLIRRLLWVLNASSDYNKSLQVV